MDDTPMGGDRDGTLENLEGQPRLSPFIPFTLHSHAGRLMRCFIATVLYAALLNPVCALAQNAPPGVPSAPALPSVPSAADKSKGESN